MLCGSSLTALHRTPHLVLDTSAQACSTLATASVSSWQMLQKSLGSEAGGRRSCGQSPCRLGGASHQPEASCCTSSSLKSAAAIRHSVGWNNHHTPCVQCLYLPPPMGMKIAGLGHFLCDSVVGVPGTVWSFFSWPCLGTVNRIDCRKLLPELWAILPCQGRAVLGDLGRCGWSGSQPGSILLLWSHALGQEVGEVWRQVWLLAQLLIYLEVDLLTWFFLLQQGGVIPLCSVLGFPILGL